MLSLLLLQAGKEMQAPPLTSCLTQPRIDVQGSPDLLLCHCRVALLSSQICKEDIGLPCARQVLTLQADCQRPMEVGIRRLVIPLCAGCSAHSDQRIGPAVRIVIRTQRQRLRPALSRPRIVRLLGGDLRQGEPGQVPYSCYITLLPNFEHLFRKVFRTPKIALLAGNSDDRSL